MTEEETLYELYCDFHPETDYTQFKAILSEKGLYYRIVRRPDRIPVGFLFYRILAGGKVYVEDGFVLPKHRGNGYMAYTIQELINNSKK